MRLAVSQISQIPGILVVRAGVIRKRIANEVAPGAGQANVTVSEQHHLDETRLAEVSTGTGGTSASNADGTHTLQLSLFLMLLTFFFVLTSTSSFDDHRVGTVIGGIHDAFGALTARGASRGDEKATGALPILQRGTVPATGDFSSSIRAVFADVEANEASTSPASLDLVLPVSTLFVDGVAAVRADKRSLFAALGSALSEDSAERHVAVLVPADPQNSLGIRRAASVARLLAHAGTPKGHLAVGVTDAQQTLVTFRFFVLPGARP